MSEVEVVPGTTAVPGSDGEELETFACPHGPTLVRGAAAVVHDGQRHPADRALVAVCRCGKSSTQPWCDSTHRAVRDY